MIESAEDIIEHLRTATAFSLSETAGNGQNTQLPAEPVYQEPSDQDRTDILSLLDGSPIEIDLLIRETGLPASVISVLLVELELAGQIERLPGNKIIRITSL